MPRESGARHRPGAEEAAFPCPRVAAWPLDGRRGPLNDLGEYSGAVSPPCPKLRLRLIVAMSRLVMDEPSVRAVVGSTCLPSASAAARCLPSPLQRVGGQFGFPCPTCSWNLRFHRRKHGDACEIP